MPTDAEIAGLVKLPEPGGYVSSLPSAPCGDCGAPVFAVSRSMREARNEDGTTRQWESVDVHCRRCELLSDRTVISKSVIGSYDTRTGRLAIDEEARS